eukprot:CAMPEP_0204160264 /NCGR_PEP_ID=MMETSP0361-20130328/33718_1 /ASSEMBLY_ACC=CAM_ASM_000343 /TAXON_ID=268821 /ORGANISM="Scrippsiella Hangoei, Strain SHTV-5" /LENGTH=80 /DNA_ID=CAMNT_0051116505 /DNA_START=26 /DNA_END=264 /DNA_ORIENTATION=-
MACALAVHHRRDEVGCWVVRYLFEATLEETGPTQLATMPLAQKTQGILVVHVLADRGQHRVEVLECRRPRPYHHSKAWAT